MSLRPSARAIRLLALAPGLTDTARLDLRAFLSVCPQREARRILRRLCTIQAQARALARARRTWLRTGGLGRDYGPGSGRPKGVGP